MKLCFVGFSLWYLPYHGVYGFRPPEFQHGKKPPNHSLDTNGLSLRGSPPLKSTTNSSSFFINDIAIDMSSSSNSKWKSTRWTDSSRWEQSTDVGEQFLLKEKYGTYFKVPNPATLFTKIVCTIGPKTSDPTIIGRMMDAGM